jgi:hypothetical protein
VRWSGSDLDGLARQTNQATASIDGNKAARIPCKKSGIDYTIATMGQLSNAGRLPRRLMASF